MHLFYYICKRLDYLGTDKDADYYQATGPRKSMQHLKMDGIVTRRPTEM